jgi:hypothetical protein
MTRRRISRRRASRRRPRRRISRRRAPKTPEAAKAEAGAKAGKEEAGIPEEAKAALEEVRRRLDRCPRCGRGGWIESKPLGRQIYLYYVHPIKVEEEGVIRRRVEKCYLGPLVYKAAQIANPLGLAGFLDPSRFLRYALAAIEKLDLRELLELRGKIDERIRFLGGGAEAHVPKEA